MAMALMAADFIDIQSIPADKQNELQTIIAKSYPEFVQQITTQLPIKHGNETATRRQRHGNGSRGQAFDYLTYYPYSGRQ